MAYTLFQSGVEVDTSRSAIYNPMAACAARSRSSTSSSEPACAAAKPMLPVEGIPAPRAFPYASCADIGRASKFISDFLKVPLPPEGAPSCETTRVTLSALRLGQIRCCVALAIRRCRRMRTAKKSRCCCSPYRASRCRSGRSLALAVALGADKTFVVGAQGTSVTSWASRTGCSAGTSRRSTHSAPRRRVAGRARGRASQAGGLSRAR